MRREETGSHRAVRATALTIILVVALVLRVWHLDYDLPDIYEEATPSLVAWNMWGWEAGGIDPNPHFFHYPALVFYLHFLGQVVYYLTGRVAGWFSSPEGMRALYDADPGGIIVTGRLVTALFAVATVWAVARLGRRLGGAVVGLGAGAILAVLSLHVRLGRTILVDTPGLFFVALALHDAVAIAEEGRRRHYITAGLWTGLAASAKYPGALVALAVALGHLIAAKRASGGPLRFIDRPALLGSALAAVGAFAVTSPYCLIDFAEFWKDFGVERRHMAGGHFGLDPGGALAAYASILWKDLGPGLLLLALFGLASRVMRLRESPAWLVPMAFTVFVLVVMSSWSMYGAHYLAPALPGVALLAAAGARHLATLLVRRRPLRLELVTGLVMTVSLVPAAVRSTSEVSAAGRPDNRSLARLWLLDRAEGALVALEHQSADLERDIRAGARLRAVRIPLSVLSPERSAAFYDLRWYQDFDCVVVSDGVRARFLAEPARFGGPIDFHRALSASWTEAAVFDRGRGPRIEIFLNPVPVDARSPRALPEDLFQDIGMADHDVSLRFLETMGDAFASREWYEPAASIFRATARFFPRHEPSLYNLGAVSVVLGRYEDAVLALGVAIRLRPDRAESYNNMGIALAGLGRDAEARGAFRRALAVDPANARARENLRRLETGPGAPGAP